MNHEQKVNGTEQVSSVLNESVMQEREMNQEQDASDQIALKKVAHLKESVKIVKTVSLDSETVNSDIVDAKKVMRTSSTLEVEEDKPSGEPLEEPVVVHEDFENCSKEELVAMVKKLAKHDNPFYAEKQLREITPFFETIRNAEIELAKSEFIKENETEDGFDFKLDDLSNRFDANSRLIIDRKYSLLKDKESIRQSNLKKAEDTLEKLRLLVHSEESSISFVKFKEIQKEWKSIGDIPSQFTKTLWANYNALVNLFYDQRSIYFELKELDRKKNYEAKVLLCERAEVMLKTNNLNDAIHILNDLHVEYKHMGPVPEKLQEKLWNRFKMASDQIYQRRKEFVAEFKKSREQNLVKKEELLAQISSFLAFDSDRIKEWNAKTRELLELQKQWETIGGIPREKSKEINKAFWTKYKAFFRNKNMFFKKLDARRNGNYNLKLELVKKAEKLKENTDWITTAEEFKRLQLEWKEIGPVPEKVKKEVYEKFKTACDTFFENGRASSKNAQQDFKENLAHKMEIITQIADWTSEPEKHIEAFKVKTKEFSKLGFVPRKDIDSIKEKFKSEIESFINALSICDDEKDKLRMEVELGDILNRKNSESILYGKERNLRKQVTQLENDVALWRNNLGFFAHSKNADGLREEVNSKIAKAEEKIALYKNQLKVLRSV